MANTIMNDKFNIKSYKVDLRRVGKIDSSLSHSCEWKSGRIITNETGDRKERRDNIYWPDKKMFATTWESQL